MKTLRYQTFQKDDNHLWAVVKGLQRLNGVDTAHLLERLLTEKSVPEDPVLLYTSLCIKDYIQTTGHIKIIWTIQEK